MRGFCLLVETLGVYPDAVAAEAVLGVLCKVLKINIGLSRLSVAARGTEKILDSAGFLGAQRKPTYPTYV
jgi:proteasome assembly chaperone (PAC2) family protein